MNVAITGGGIAGLTTAIALRNAGVSCTIYEAAPDIRPVGAGIALAANAMQAFARLGIQDAIMQKGSLLNAFTIKEPSGRILTKTDSVAMSQKFGADNFTIHRADLHRTLLSYIDPACIRTNKRCVDITQTPDRVTLHFSDGTSAEADYLLACDGIRSPVRQKLLPDKPVRYAGYTCWRAVVDMPGLTLTEATETWGTEGRFGVVPLTGQQVYWFACINSTPRNEAYKRYTPDDLLWHFGKFHDPIPALLERTRPDQLIWTDINDLTPIDRYAFGNILLLGDAAHATTPNMGQGACQAIEDAVVLAQEWYKHLTVEAAFLAFEKRRLSRTHAIVNRSRQAGKVAQLSSPILAAIRNFVFRQIPASVSAKQLESVLTVDF